MRPRRPFVHWSQQKYLNLLDLCKSTGAIAAMIHDLKSQDIKTIRGWCDWILWHRAHRRTKSKK